MLCVCMLYLMNNIRNFVREFWLDVIFSYPLIWNLTHVEDRSHSTSSLRVPSLTWWRSCQARPPVQWAELGPTGKAHPPKRHSFRPLSTHPSRWALPAHGSGNSPIQCRAHFLALNSARLSVSCLLSSQPLAFLGHQPLRSRAILLCFTSISYGIWHMVNGKSIFIEQNLSVFGFIAAPAAAFPRAESLVTSAHPANTPFRAQPCKQPTSEPGHLFWKDCI